MKKSKLIAALLISVLLLSVSPSFAYTSKTRTWGEVHEEGKEWGLFGMITTGVIMTGMVVFTGGATLPVVIGVGLEGAAIGGGLGYAAGAIGENGRDAIADTAGVIGKICSWFQ